MAKVIDELLIAIGFDPDESGAKAVQSSFDGIRSAALQMGGAITGALSLKSITTDFAQANDAMGKFSDFMKADVSLVYDFARAIEHNGGAADDAFSAIERLAEIQDSLSTGVGVDWMKDVAIASNGMFDPSVIQRGMSFNQILSSIAGEMEGLNADQRRRTSSALGFDMGVAQTLQSRDYLKSQLDAVRQFGTVTKGMTKVAADFNDASQDLRDLSLDIRNEISLGLLPTIIDQMREVSSFYSDNREEFQKGIEEIVPYLETTAQAVLALVAIQGGKKGATMLAANLPTAAAVVVATGLMDEYTKQQQGEFNLFDSMSSRWDAQKQEWSSWFNGSENTGMPVSMLGLPDSDIMNKPGVNQSQKDEFMSRSAKMLNSSSVVNHNNITIQASGLTEKQMEGVVYKVINGAANQTEQDLKVNSQ